MRTLIDEIVLHPGDKRGKMSIEVYGEPSALFLLASDAPAAADNWMIKVVAEDQDQVLRNLSCKRIQVDEIWSFVYSKQANIPKHKLGEAGDVWTWTAVDADTKLLPTWMVGPRDGQAAITFIDDLASRLANRVQLTSDGFHPYLRAVEGAFGCEIDYAMLVKLYGSTPEGEVRYSPAVCSGARKTSARRQPRS